MKYIQPPWENYFFSKVQAAKSSLFISSPYIKFPVASLLCKVLESKCDSPFSIQLLTRIRISDLIDGASDLEAFEMLLQLAEKSGLDVAVKCISNLHAKVYIFDENSAIVTSSNLTPSGLKLNVEYGIEVTERGTVQQILDDMNTYWRAAAPLTAGMIEQVENRLRMTESVVTVDQNLRDDDTPSLTSEPSIAAPSIGKRFAPQGQDIDFAELDDLRKDISATSKYRKRSKVIITRPDIPIADEPDVDHDHADQETDRSIIEVESSYGELEEDSVERLIRELESDVKQRRRKARRRLEVLFALDDSCIMPYTAELADANLKLCCRFLRYSRDRRAAVSHLLDILKTESQSGSLPNPILNTLNHIAPEQLYSFLRRVLQTQLSSSARLNAIEWLKNAAAQLSTEAKDSAFEIFKKFTEGKLDGEEDKFCNAAYIAMGQVGSAKSKEFLRKAFNQAQEHRMPLQIQMSILRGFIAAGISADDESMLLRLSHSHLVRFRAMSAKALSQLGESSWQRLVDMAKSDSDGEVRIQAMRALVKLNTTNAHKVLIELVEIESEEEVKDSILSLIKRCRESAQGSPTPSGPPSQSTISELNSPDHRIRRRAVRALGKSKHESAVAPLCNALKDENEYVRTSAAEALGTISNNESLLPLIEVLENDPYNHARAAAAKSLGKFEDKRAVDALRNGLNDKNGLVRKWCVRSLDEWRVKQLTKN